MDTDTKATLYLNMIIGDFEPVETVQRSIDSVKDYVDGMYITLTYKDKKPAKTHDLVKLLTSYGATISYFHWTKNFAEARQFALDQIPQETNVFVYWQDADDVLANGDQLHRVADEMILHQQAAVYFEYWYQVDLDEAGNVREILVKHKRERIIRHDGTWKWVGDLHETLIEQRSENIIKVFRPECHIIHLTNGQRLDHNIGRNVEILEESLKRQGQKRDPRTVIYLAKAYFDMAKMTEDKERELYTNMAVTLFHEYLNGAGTPGEAGYQEPSGWKEERSTAWSYIGEIAILSGHPEVAIQAYQSAIDECPYFPNYYVDMALCYVMADDFKRARHWLNVATSMPEPETTIITFPRELKTRALEVSFQCNMHEQKLEWAKKDAEMLLEIMPESDQAKERLKTVKQLWEYNKAAQSIVFLGKYLEAVGEKDKLPHLVNAIPQAMETERFAAEMKHLFMPARDWEAQEIAILCGPGFEHWDPTSVATGLGGSEEAVVYLSQELTKIGWKVTVYGNPKTPGDFDGVTYKPWRDINPRDSFNVLILWRSIGFVDVNPQAKFTMVWMHDVPNNQEFTEERLAKVDRVAVLSEFHKSLLRVPKNGGFEKFPEGKVFLTANGLPEINITEWKGNPKRVIHAQSPDRGLVYLLKMWPQVMAEVPDAELHVYYGWGVYDAIHKDNPARMRWKKQVMDMMKQDGVIYHGRVGHDELHQAYNQSGIWAYPTDFEEISCISAMKAQKLGAIPVVTDYAALQETVRNGYRLDVDITDKEGQEEYRKALIELLKDEKKQEELRKPMMEWAKDYFAWSNIAKTWSEHFKSHVLLNDAKNYQTKPEASQPSGDIATS